MTAAELVYLAAGVGVGVPATIIWQRYRTGWRHRRAHRAAVTRLHWHPSHGPKRGT